MSDSGECSRDDISPRETEFVEKILREVNSEPWAAQLLSNIFKNGGLTCENKAKFFELRFGYALHRAGVIPRYEVKGEACSTLDFGLTSSGQSWLVEMMRFEETKALRRATRSWADTNRVV